MALTAITHWYKVGGDVYEPLSLKPETADAEIAAHGLAHCKPCGALVKPTLVATSCGQQPACPFCDALLPRQPTVPSDDLVGCPHCGETVEPEGKLDATGIRTICPECGEDLPDA